MLRERVPLLLALVLLSPLGTGSVNLVRGLDVDVHVTPTATTVLVFQNPYTVLVDIASNFNETGVQMNVGNVTTDDFGTYTVEVESIRTPGSLPGNLNLTVSTTLGVPDVGNYTLYVVEPALSSVLAVENFTVVRTDRLFSVEGLVASLKVYLNYDEVEFRAVSPAPYGDARFWINSTSPFPLTLGIRLNETKTTLANVVLALVPLRGAGFSLEPALWTYGRLDAFSSSIGYFNLTTRNVPAGHYSFAYTLNYTHTTHTHYTDAEEFHSLGGSIHFAVFTAQVDWNSFAQTGTTRLVSPSGDRQESFFYDYATTRTLDGYDLKTWRSYNSTADYSNVTLIASPVVLAPLVSAAIRGAAMGAWESALIEYARQIDSGDDQRFTWQERAWMMVKEGTVGALTGGLLGAAPRLSAFLQGERRQGHFFYSMERRTTIIENVDRGLSFVRLGLEPYEGVRQVSSSQLFQFKAKVGPPENTVEYIQAESVGSVIQRFDPTPSSRLGSNVREKLLPPASNLSGEWTGIYLWAGGGHFDLGSLLSGFLPEPVVEAKGRIYMSLAQSGNNLTGFISWIVEEERVTGACIVPEEQCLFLSHVLDSTPMPVVGLISGSRVRLISCFSGRLLQVEFCSFVPFNPPCVPPWDAYSTYYPGFSFESSFAYRDYRAPWEFIPFFPGSFEGSFECSSSGTLTNGSLEFFLDSKVDGSYCLGACLPPDPGCDPCLPNRMPSRNAIIFSAALGRGQFIPLVSVQSLPGSVTVDAGSSASLTIVVNSFNGFAGNVLLTVLAPPGISVSLSQASVRPPANGYANSMLTVNALNTQLPGGYDVIVTWMIEHTSLSSSSIVPISVTRRQNVSCGLSTCSIQSSEVLSNVGFTNGRIRFTVTGDPDTTGFANVTIPRLALADINNLKIFVNGIMLSRSALTIAMDTAQYSVYFTFTFRSTVEIEIELSPGFLPLTSPPLVLIGVGMVFLAIVVSALMFRKRRSGSMGRS